MTEKHEQDVDFEKAIKTLDLAEKKMYKPINMFSPGYVSFNFLVYKTFRGVSNFTLPNSDFLIEFTKDTNKELGVHSLYVLYALRKEYLSTLKELKRLKRNGIKENYIPTFDEFMSEQTTGKGTKVNVDDQIALNNAYRTNIQNAMLKLSKEIPFYVI
jgi:hypothetical protein